VTAADVGPDRLARLREAAGDMDEALREEGFESFGSHAVFVRWQRASVEALAGIVVEAEGILDKSRREGEADRRRVERLIEATSNALAMAHRAAENAGEASAYAQQMIDESVAGIQRRMSDALVKECPNWLILEQKFRHREYAWKLATRVAIGAIALFIAGYATSQYWNLPLTESRQAMFNAVDRCWYEPMKVRMSNGTTMDVCPLADLTSGRPK
jgi:hypothetical protein